MTKEERVIFNKVQVAVAAAKDFMMRAEDQIESAADSCKGYPMEDQLNSIFDELTDLRFDLGKQLENFKKRLNGEGNDAPESWSA